jgi:catechol 2,3-dioxygenase-like lactoylglutathione lyase family enzyme
MIVMLGKHELVAFLATRDPARARAFYEGILGLALVEESAFALVFDARGTTLRIQKVGDLQPHPFTALGWQVPRIEEVVAELAQKQVAMERFAGMDQDARGIWRAPSGARVAWFKDPDGNTLSITQL